MPVGFRSGSLPATTAAAHPFGLVRYIWLRPGPGRVWPLCLRQPLPRACPSTLTMDHPAAKANPLAAAAAPRVPTFGFWRHLEVALETGILRTADIGRLACASTSAARACSSELGTRMSNWLIRRTNDLRGAHWVEDDSDAPP